MIDAFSRVTAKHTEGEGDEKGGMGERDYCAPGCRLLTVIAVVLWRYKVTKRGGNIAIFDVWEVGRTFLLHSIPEPVKPYYKAEI